MRALLLSILTLVPPASFAAEPAGTAPNDPAILSCWESAYQPRVGRFYVWVLDNGDARIQHDQNLCRDLKAKKGGNCTLREFEPVTLPASAAVTKPDGTKAFDLGENREIDFRGDASGVNDVRARVAIDGTTNEIPLVRCGQ